MDKQSYVTYRREYNKKNYSYINVPLKKDEYNELNKLLEEKKLTKPQFVRLAIQKILKEQ